MTFFFNNRKFLNMNLQKIIGQNIRDLRLAKRWSQEKLAWTSHLSSNYLSSLERGIVNVSIDVLERLAKSLEVEVKNLLEK